MIPSAPQIKVMIAARDFSTNSKPLWSSSSEIVFKIDSWQIMANCVGRGKPGVRFAVAMKKNGYNALSASKRLVF